MMRENEEEQGNTSVYLHLRPHLGYPYIDLLPGCKSLPFALEQIVRWRRTRIDLYLDLRQRHSNLEYPIISIVDIEQSYSEHVTNGSELMIVNVTEVVIEE